MPTHRLISVADVKSGDAVEIGGLQGTLCKYWITRSGRRRLQYRFLHAYGIAVFKSLAGRALRPISPADLARDLQEATIRCCALRRNRRFNLVAERLPSPFSSLPRARWTALCDPVMVDATMPDPVLPTGQTMDPLIRTIPLSYCGTLSMVMATHATSDSSWALPLYATEPGVASLIALRGRQRRGRPQTI